MKPPEACGALGQAPDPTLAYARFVCTTLLRCVGKIGWTRAGPLPWPNPGSATVRQWWIQGGATGMCPPPMGPDSFILTYKFFET